MKAAINRIGLESFDPQEKIDDRCNPSGYPAPFKMITKITGVGAKVGCPWYAVTNLHASDIEYAGRHDENDQ